jgi:dihydrofolate reductase
MAVALIAALADNGVIGSGNRLPWHLPPDLRRFRRLTLGHWMVLGRKTFESIGKPLPGRKMVVLTRQPGYAPPGVHVAHSLPRALELARAGGAEGGAMPGGERDVFIGGGSEVYAEALALRVADRLWLTRIHRDFPGDTFFPAFDLGEWRLVEDERHEPDAEAPFAYSFQLYERRAG